ncbi:MAG: metal ABC transporter substrate-binding protein [Planctomycetaceae bacterium]
MTRPVYLAIVLTCGMFAVGCQQKPDEQGKAAAPQTSVVVVTSQVALEATKELAGSHYDVLKVVPGSTVSRLWTPESQDVKVMQKASLIFLQGAGYDPWKDRASLPGSRVTDLSRGIYDDFIRIPDAVTHQHGPEGKHSHPGTVWATWLNPELLLPQISTIETALAKKKPDAADEISKAAAVLRSQIQSQTEKIQALRTSLNGRKISLMADNSNYLYLAKALGLECRYLHWPESGDLSEEQLQEFQKLQEQTPDEGLRVFLLDARQSASTRTMIDKAGFRLVQIDLCESGASHSGEKQTNESVWKRLAGNLERLSAALQP